MCVETRKIQLVGARSYAVSLPKDWVIGQGLDKQSTVFIKQTPNHELIITAQHTEAKPTHITLDLSELPNVQEFLVLCYVKNIDSITLTAKHITYEQAKDIKHVIEYLEGYDITSEDETHITISFLFKQVTIRIQDIERRMTYILGLMLEALHKKDSETLHSLEKEVDRLYHLSKRVIFGCTRNTKVREENGVQDVENLFFHNIIFKKIENIADAIIDLQEHAPSTKDEKILSQLIGLLRELFVKRQDPHSIMSEVERIPASSHERVVRITELVTDVLENSISLYYTAQHFSHNA